MKTVVQFGAGNIGRGFTGQLFTEAGYEVVFVDVDPELVQRLNERREYPLRLVGPDRRETLRVRPVRAVDGRDPHAVAEELSQADFACTAVGVRALPLLAPGLAAGLRARHAAGAGALNVILCENQLHCGDVLRRALRQCFTENTDEWLEQVGLVESVVTRMVPVTPPREHEQEPLLVVADDFATLEVDAAAFRGEAPDVPTLRLVTHFIGHVERKLYCHNMAHALTAYLGQQQGYSTIDQAIGDPRIEAVVARALDQVGRALIRRHEIPAEDQRDYAEELLRRFRNPDLHDTLLRVGRDPARKLGRHDRLVGASQLCLRSDIHPDALLAGIVAAVETADYFADHEDDGAQTVVEAMAAGGIDAVIIDICELSPDEPLADLIRTTWRARQ